MAATPWTQEELAVLIENELAYKDTRWSAANAMTIELQDIVCLSPGPQQGEVAGSEALTRIITHGRRMIDPSRWFQAARSINLGRAMAVEAHSASLAVDAARTTPGSSGTLAVNFSPDLVLSPDVQKALNKLQQFSQDTGRGVNIELSEHHHPRDAGILQRVVWSIRRRGFSVAIDDAGTGGAQLPFVDLVLGVPYQRDALPSVVKIDNRHGDLSIAANVAFVQPFVERAAAHNARVTIEGINSSRALMAAKGLQQAYPELQLYGQGFWLSRHRSEVRSAPAMPLDAMLAAAMAVDVSSRTATTQEHLPAF